MQIRLLSVSLDRRARAPQSADSAGIELQQHRAECAQGGVAQAGGGGQGSIATGGGISPGEVGAERKGRASYVGGQRGVAGVARRLERRVWRRVAGGGNRSETAGADCVGVVDMLVDSLGRGLQKCIVCGWKSWRGCKGRLCCACESTDTLASESKSSVHENAHMPEKVHEHIGGMDGTKPEYPDA